MPTVIEAEISWREICDIKTPVPLEVQMRNLLNSKGFKFLDDGKPSLIVNKSPTPLGTFYVDEDFINHTLRFRQVLDT